MGTKEDALAALVATVPDQEAVYAADLAAATETKEPLADVPPAEKTPTDHAIDGRAWYVFNTLRGAADVVALDDGTVATFAEVRALIAAGKL